MQHGRHSPTGVLTVGDGEMAQRIRELDWSRTPLGPPASWSQSLGMVLQICLTTHLPLMLLWGREGIAIYNDALAPLIGDKHPGALGRPFFATFPELLEEHGPRFRAVMERGESSFEEDRQISFWRNGMLEEMHYTFSWSPIRDESDAVVGAFHPAWEATGHVVGARRLRALRDLSAGTLGAQTRERACRQAAERLRAHRADMPFALLYLLSGNGRTARLAGNMGAEQGDGEAVLALGSDDDRWRLGEAVRTGPLSMEPVHDLRLLPGAPWPEPCREAVVLPLGIDEEELPLGLLVAGVSPRRRLDDDYWTWLNLVGSHLGGALASAQRHERHRAIAITLQESLLPARLPDFEGVEIVTRYRPASAHAQVGGDWYDAVQTRDDTLVVVIGDVVGKGVQAAAIMGRLRSAARAYAVLGLPPARILTELNRFALGLEHSGLEFATLACACYDRSAGTLTMSSAGHLPPLLVRADGSRLVEGGLTVPVGVREEIEAEEHVIALEVGDAVLLYTDGLVERRDQDLDRGLALLSEQCAQHHDDLVAMLDACMADVAGPNGEDDVAVLALRRLD